ncbi:BMP family lipoprotein [Saccharibacillus alkalitolerans]|uniref:BMP family ABC transporter substrate-binding protein n=1 Tax=Saccharibacillus alkalitolerans TaxID=2705290 RepID=A0ABX0F9I7_9BACL|nr:BMP family ABC transporter substrate-binding protein [Saccharibacillus alkalitolerans]NGZ77065.1 BMP family ABC transporter substrate-binding protein [Saccharibacillus alkalitolerans]
MQKGKKTKRLIWIPALSSLLLLAACGSQQSPTAGAEERPEVGVVLSDVGLGDQSYSDAAFRGLAKARDTDGVLFDYREMKQAGTYDEAFKQLVDGDNDLVIGLGYMVKESLEKIAKEYPDKQFLIVDDTSELPNVASITFKEEEGSYLAGAVAGLTTKSNHVGFLGGVESDLLKKFEAGYEQGVKAANPQADVKTTYAGDFGKADLGASIAGSMMQNDDIDVVYAAAGLTGVGALQEAEKEGKYAIGVDTDQFFIAEKAVVTSMVKNVDNAIYSAVKTFNENGGKFPQKDMVFGLKEEGVGLAPIRVVNLTPEQQKRIDELTQDLISGKITIQLP